MLEDLKYLKQKVWIDVNLSDRWDNPMFVVEFDEELPCEEIANALFDGKKPKAPVSTKPVINKL